MSRVPDLIFEYRNKGKGSLKGRGMTNIAISIVVFLIFLIGFIIFLYEAFKINIKYVWLANLFGLLALIFGPYLYIKNKHYYFALTEDGVLIIKCMVNLIPRTYKIELNDISEIIYPDPVKTLSVVFKNKNGKVLGSFNHLIMGYNQFKKYLDVISLRNKNIDIKV